MWYRLVQGTRLAAQISFRADAAIPKKQYATNTSTGALLPEPKKTPFGLLGLACAVIPGLLLGAAISKNIANFLEENDLFVPSDDDDDDD